MRLPPLSRHLARQGCNHPTPSSRRTERASDATSTRRSRGYWQVPRSFGLLETVGERLALTPDGATYLASTSPELLLTVIRKSVAGFDELLAELDQHALSADEGLRVLTESLGVEWESDAQVKFRLGWLESLGVAKQRGGRSELVRNRDTE